MPVVHEHAGMNNGLRLGVVTSFLAFVVVQTASTACGGDDHPPPENAGQSCSTPAQCYPGIDGGALKGGAVQCLTSVPNGYCTHLCTTDADCCAVSGECPSGKKQVCAPFQSTGQMMCFLSCEAADVTASGVDETTFCQRFADAAFGCRSTGGGQKNRKVCVP
jgi:hypothetical protein